MAYPLEDNIFVWIGNGELLLLLTLPHTPLMKLDQTQIFELSDSVLERSLSCGEIVGKTAVMPCQIFKKVNIIKMLKICEDVIKKASC